MRATDDSTSQCKSLSALKQIPFHNNSHIEKIKIISQRLKGEKKKKDILYDYFRLLTKKLKLNIDQIKKPLKAHCNHYGFQYINIYNDYFISITKKAAVCRNCRKDKNL